MRYIKRPLAILDKVYEDAREAERTRAAPHHPPSRNVSVRYEGLLLLRPHTSLTDPVVLAWGRERALQNGRSPPCNRPSLAEGLTREAAHYAEHRGKRDFSSILQSAPVTARGGRAAHVPMRHGKTSPGDGTVEKSPLCKRCQNDRRPRQPACTGDSLDASLRGRSV